jgi:hypothetical protein
MNIFAKTGEFPSSCSVEDVNTSHQIRDQGGLLEFFILHHFHYANEFCNRHLYWLFD